MLDTCEMERDHAPPKQPMDAPSKELQQQADRYIQRHLPAFGDTIARRDVEIKNDHARRDGIRSGMYIMARPNAREVPIREHCSVVFADLIVLFLNHHALTTDGGQWFKE